MGADLLRALQQKPEFDHWANCLQVWGEKLAAISTAKFQMVDEMETGAKFFGATLKTVEGEVKSPDGARMLVDVEVPAMGFVEIEISGGRGPGIYEVLQRRTMVTTACGRRALQFRGDRRCFERIDCPS